MSYRNQPTVNVVLIDVADIGLVAVQRADNLMFTLPGGFQEIPESVRDGAVREVQEETGISLNPYSLILRNIVTTPDGTKNLVFWVAHIGYGTWMDALSEFTPNEEIIDMTTFNHPWVTPFDLHTKEIEDYFKNH